MPLAQVDTIAGFPEVTFIRTAVPAKTHHPAQPLTTASSVPATVVGPVRRASDSVTVPTYKGSVSFELRAARVRNQLLALLAAREPSPLPFIGTVTSQGDKAHQADVARANYGFSGEGVRIGVMSDSFNYLGGLNADILGGNLPGPGNPFGNTTPVTIVQVSSQS